MILLNFSHPLTPAHLAQIEALTGAPVTGVRDIPTQLDLNTPFAEHAPALADAAGLTPAQWQTEGLLLALPAWNEKKSPYALRFYAISSPNHRTQASCSLTVLYNRSSAVQNGQASSSASAR